MVAENRKTSTRRIKILFFIDFLHGFGGTERHLFNLAGRLNRDRFECTVCPFRFNSETIEIFRNAGIEVVPAPFSRIYGLSAIKQARRLTRFIRERRFDVVQTFNIDSDIYGTLVARLAGGPVVIGSRRDLGAFRKNRHIKITKITNQYIRHFLAVCESVARSMTEREAVPASKITTVYNGFDLATLKTINQARVAKLRAALDLGPNSFVIGNVSHFRPEKGHDIFLEAIAKIRNQIPDLRVLMLGGSAGSTLQARYRQKIKDQKLGDHLFMPGYIDHVLDYLAVMDIGCLTPVSNEGFSNAILEQMAMGIPVIASDIGGNAEAVADGESGFIVPVNDADAVADAILKLYHNHDLRKQFGDEARRRVETEFSMDKMIERMESFYFSLN